MRALDVLHRVTTLGLVTVTLAGINNSLVAFLKF